MSLPKAAGQCSFLADVSQTGLNTCGGFISAAESVRCSQYLQQQQQQQQEECLWV